jgi:universal stress protein E
VKTLRRILVAIKEPRARSLPALAKAAQLARRSGAALELFSDLDEPMYLGTSDVRSTDFRAEAARLRGRRLAELESLAAGLRRKGLAVTTAAEWDFPAHEAIVRRAARIRADLIVAQRSDAGRLARSFLRLTDWELVRHSPVPLLLVKHRRPYRRPAILAAVDPTHTHAKPSGLDSRILNAAEVLRRSLNGTLHVVHSFVPVPVGATPAEILDAGRAADLEARVAKEARKRLERTISKAGLHVAPSRRHVTSVHPYDAIGIVARETRSSLVVMGALSRSGLKRLLIGNTAERLLDALPCDVLVVKPARFASRVPRGRRGLRLIAPQAFVLD